MKDELNLDTCFTFSDVCKEIKDTRKGASGRPLEHELTDKEKLERAEAKIKLLEAENELLKKNELIEMGILTDIKSISNLKQ